jgi:ABC-type microcin C transport system duplicated ATPase subunit YejF
MHNEAEREMVMQAEENAFAVYTPIPFTAHGTCLNGSRITRVLSKSTVIQLDSGCNLQLKEHLIEVPFSLISPRVPLISSTSWDTLEVPRKLLREEDRRQMDLFRALVNASYDEREFRDGLRYPLIGTGAQRQRM